MIFSYERTVLKNSDNITRKTSIKSVFGMHARPASGIAQIAGSAQGGVWLHANSKKVDATSILDILLLSATRGTEVLVEIEDQKDMEILDKIIDFFEIGFGEATE